MSVNLKHNIPETLRHEINQVTEKLELGLKGLRSFREVDLKAFSQNLPKKYDANAPWDDHIVGIASIRSEVNDAAGHASKLSDHAQRLFDALIGEASLSGSSEYYASLEYPKAKITDQMRLNYANMQPEIQALSEKVAEATALKWFFKNEHDGLVSTERNFTRYAIRASGG